MAPPKQAQAPFSKDERVLCFHMEMLYEAKILDVQQGEDGDGWQYKIHYKGWKASWDDWVPQDRVRKFTDENKELASQLMTQYKMLQSGKAAKQAKKGGKAMDSDFSSMRGSEERMPGGPAQTGRGGPRRTRDYDLENVSVPLCLRFDGTGPHLCAVRNISSCFGNSATLPPNWRSFAPACSQVVTDALASLFTVSPKWPSVPA